MTQNDLQAGIVRILDSDGDTAGTGFIVSAQLVVTCAHVISHGETPPETVDLVFLVDDQKTFTASVMVEYWRDETQEDLAVLFLQETLPAKAIPLQLGTSVHIEGHQFKTYGFPKGKPKKGMGGKGTIDHLIKHENNCSLIQLSSTEITNGFSGAPVVDKQTSRVVGVVVERTSPEWEIVEIKKQKNIMSTERGSSTAFAIPTSVLCEVCPELKIEDICPYVGLSAFTEADKDYFHGRNKLITDLANNLRDYPYFLAVVGSSGSGKSSVISAGLFAEIKQNSIFGFENSKIIQFRPGNDPRESLVNALQSEIEINNFWEEVEKYLDLPNLQNRTIIFVDQFEELFALCSPSVQKDFTEGFFNLINKSSFITLIITIRSDFYEPLQNSCFGDWLKGGQVNVKPMTDEEVKSAITDPARKVGLQIQPGLVGIIARDIKNIRHFLPLLEFTLTELWKKEHKNNCLTYEGYSSIGGVTGSLVQKAEETFHKLNQSEQQLTRQIFTRLINYSSENIPDTRLPPLSIEELEVNSKENQDIRNLVTKFADARLLVTSFDEGSRKETVEIIHEALILYWKRLDDWVKEDRENLLLRQTIDQQALEWDYNNRNEGDLALSEKRLKSAEALLEQENFLSEVQVDYVKASLDKRKKEEEHQAREKSLMQENLEEKISKLAEAARNNSKDNKKLAALTKLIKAGNLLQESPNPEIRADVKLHFLITFGQIFDEIAEKNSFGGHTGWITGVSFSPYSQTIASSSSDKTIKLWSFDGNLLQTLEGHEDEVMDISFSPDGEMIASASQDKTIRLWKKSTDTKTQWILDKTLEGHSGWIVGVSFSPDNQIIASASEDKTVKLWHKNGNLLHTFNGHEDGVINVVFSPDGKLIASASKDRTIKLWDLEKYELQSSSEEHFEEVSAVSFGLDSNTFISSSWDKYVMFWKNDGNVPSVVRSEAHEAKVYYTTFSPDGQKIAASGEDGLITIWDKNGDFKRTFKGHRDSVTKVSFSSDSKTLVSGSFDGTIKIWDCTGKFDGHSSEIVKIDFRSDGETIATASEDGTVKLWQRNGELLSSFKYHNDRVFYTDIKFSPDGKTIATASYNEVKIWNFKGKKKESFSEHNNHVHSIHFNPEGTEIAIGYVDGTVILWNIDDDESRILTKDTETKHIETVNMLTFSPQGTMIATASADKTVKLWDLNGNLLAQREYENAAYYATFSDDGGLIATASMTENDAHKIELWNPNNNDQQIQILKENFNRLVMGLGFIAEGKIVAAISDDQTIRLWNTADGKLLQTIEGNDNSSIGAACIFSSQNDRSAISSQNDRSAISSQNDRSAIAVANSDENRINLWSLSLEELLKNSTNQICDYTKRQNV
ncbi:trypsin-like peptidase domain-containing protein [Aphanizomenon sp. PH219]|nr:trypsin-like peptidase domain-containing protein [Aphanizomenon sp. 202]MDK2457761.1 trypsin-like peptidase domain-containing protein [Aphanizomenon sp. PH219]